jgi:hypothetical protein
MERRTMRGKVVGSYKPPANDFAVWPEAGGYVVVAPSGARMTRHADLSSAVEERDRRQREWVVPPLTK